MEIQQNAKEFLSKIDSFSTNLADLSSGEDLSIAIMNLISIEEHLYFTGMKTNKKDYFKLLGTVREMRVKLLKEIVGQPEGEVWCISKHLLGASMRLIEVGTKYSANKKNNEANEKYEQAFDLYSLFWNLNLGSNKSDEIATVQKTGLLEGRQKTSQFIVMRDIVKKIVDCCKEL